MIFERTRIYSLYTPYSIYFRMKEISTKVVSGFALLTSLRKAELRAASSQPSVRGWSATFPTRLGRGRLHMAVYMGFLLCGRRHNLGSMLWPLIFGNYHV